MELAKSYAVLPLPVLLFFLLTFSVSFNEAEIWFSGYQPTDSFNDEPTDEEFRSRDQYQSDYASKNKSDYVIFNEVTRSITFTCEADYPITWNFPYPEQWKSTYFSDVESKAYQTSTFSQNALKPTSVKFRIEISILLSALHSANLTCAPTAAQTEDIMQFSVHIYAKGYLLLEYEGQELHVYAEDVPKRKFIARKLPRKKLPPVIFPCRPALPELEVILEKRISNQTNSSEPEKWERINVSEKHMTFDPKLGFTLQRGLLGNRIFGLYKCSVILEEDDGPLQKNKSVVYVKVMKIENGAVGQKPAYHFQSTSVLRGNSSFQLEIAHREYYTEAVVTCCTGVPGKRANMYLSSCTDPLQCMFLKELYLADFAESGYKHLFDSSFYKNKECQQRKVRGDSIVVICTGVNLNFTEHFVSLFHPMAANGSITNRYSRILTVKPGENTTSSTSRQISLNEFEPISSLNAVPMSQKILLLVGHIVLNYANWDEKESQDFGPVLYFSGEDIQNNKCRKEKFEEAYYRDLSKRYARFAEYNREEYYVGESVNFMCFAPKYVYASNGAQLRLVWKNGTKTVLNRFEPAAGENQCTVTVNLLDTAEMFDFRGFSATSIFGESFYASQDMSLIECWMPERRSGEWSMISKNLLVLPSVAPKFYESIEETVYFYLGDEGKFITCTVTDGLPQAKVEITRDLIQMEMDSLHKKENATGLHETHAYVEKMKENSLTIITITIRFPAVSHNNTQGLFCCTATNANGTVQRTINVLVIEKPGTALAISIGITVVLCIVILGVAIKHWMNKRSVQNLAQI